MIMTTERKILLAIGIFFVIIFVYGVITHPDGNYSEAKDSPTCNFANTLTNRTFNLQPYGSEILHFQLDSYGYGRASYGQDICVVNLKGNPVKVEAYRDDGDGKTFQEDHRIKELDNILLSSGSANTVSLSKPSGSVGLFIKIINPYNFTSDVQVAVLEKKT